MQATRGPLLEGLQQRMGGGEKRRACMRPLLEGPWQLSLHHATLPAASSASSRRRPCTRTRRSSRRWPAGVRWRRGGEEAVHTYTEIVEALARGGALEEGRGGLEGGEGR